VSKKNGIISVTVVFGALLLAAGCNSGQPAAQPAQNVPQVPAQAPPQAVPAPAQPVVTAPPAPPATPLIPVPDAPAAAPATPKKGTSSGGGIDAKLPGKGTSGDELIGNYSCAINSKKLSIGPIKPPPFGCKIFRSQSGDLKISSSSDGAGSMKGSVNDQTEAGFFVNGKYEMAGNSLAIKARMKLAGAGKYSGKGRGRFNDDKSSQIDYTLTMTRR